MNTKRYTAFIVTTLLSLSTLFATKLPSVIISEVFYDTPNNEWIDEQNPQVHHNGEFIELYNLSTVEVDLSGYILSDNSNSPYVFPANSKIGARGMIIVAYRHPDTMFKLSDLFTSLNSLDRTFLEKNIYYQNSFVLCNDGDAVSLRNPDYILIDQMSYRYEKNDPSRQYNWAINAENGIGKSVENLLSLQRKDIHTSSNLVQCLAADYQRLVATPFNKPATAIFPIVQELNNSTDASTNGSTALVGAIPGSASVTPGGAATYSIPIEVPTGINGMQPQLAVVYNSQGGRGMLGDKWDISGLSSITRGGKNIYYDQLNKRIKLDNSDAIYIDGQRLIYLNGGTGSLTAGATYATEIENYSRIVFDGSKFILTTLDGKVMEYGNATYGAEVTNAENANDKTILSWKINKVTDIYKNSMTYTYIQNGMYISKVNYTYNQGKNSGQEVSFVYSSNTINPTKNYFKTFCTIDNKTLTNIQLKSNNTVLKTYILQYNSVNQLTSVNLTGRDGSKIKGTYINWGQSSGFSFQNVGGNTDQKLIPNKGSIYSGDVNGDGYADRIEYWPGSKNNCGNNNGDRGHIIVYLFDKASKTFITYNPTTYYFRFDSETQSTSSPAPVGGDVNSRLVVADINNDGRSEIILTVRHEIFSFVYDPTKSVLTQTNNNNDLAMPVTTNGNNQLIVVDADGDNYGDVCFVYDYEYNLGHNTYRGSKNGIINNHSTSVGSSYYQNNLYEIGDFNADGIIDMLLIPQKPCRSSYIADDLSFFNDDTKKWSGVSNAKRHYSADFNNDGKTDILIQKSDNNWAILMNNTVTTEPTQKDISEFHNASDATGNGEIDGAIPIDYNADGRMDVIIGDETFSGKNFQYTTWYFYKQNLDGSFSLDNQFNASGRMAYYFTDVNGDGIPDLVFADKETTTYWRDCNGNDVPNPSTNTPTVDDRMKINISAQPEDGDCPVTQYSYSTDIYKACIMRGASSGNLVVSITNGMGQSDSFSYSNFSNYEAYNSSEADKTIRPLRSPISLAVSYTNAAGSTTTYSFDKPLVHTEGKGFLGFTTVTSINSDQNIKTISNYEINNTYFYPYLTSQSVSTVSGTNDISTSTYTNDVIVIDASNKRYLPIVTGTTSSDILKNISQTTTTNYNDYPNKIIKTDVVGDLTTTTTTTYTGRSIDPTTTTIPYLPSTIVTVSELNKEKDIREITNSYNTKGVLLTEIVDPGKPEQITTNYPETERDQWGHANKIEVTAKDANGDDVTRSSTFSYTTSGRCIATKTNSLKQTTTYAWDETTGTLTSETDPYHHTTQYRYDGFGQLSTTVYADGQSKISSLQWAATNNTLGAKYYSYSESTGNAPVTVWYDALGREIQKDSYGLNGKKISITSEYYTTGTNKNRPYRVSEPYFESEASNKEWAKTYDSYDNYGRVTKLKTTRGDIVTTFDKSKTTVTSFEGTVETKLNNRGQQEYSIKNGKKVTFDYYPSGLTKSSTPEDGQAVTMIYNRQGKRIKLIDPVSGVIRNEYNGFGEPTLEVQQIHLTGDSTKTVNSYENDGRLKSIDRNGEITSYSYYSDRPGNIETIVLKNKQSAIQHRQTFRYDSYNRLTSTTDEIADRNSSLKSFTKSKVHDKLGRISKEVFPTGYYIEHAYDAYSNLIRTTDSNGKTIWQAGTENAKGQTLTETIGKNSVTYDYNTYGLLHTINAGNASNMTYEYYGIEKYYNLRSRTDNINNQSETLDYDNLDRLTTWTVNNSVTHSITYDATTGDMTNKSDIGGSEMKYGENTKGENGKPHGITSIASTPVSFTSNLTVSYTDFKKIATLSEGSKFYQVSYGADDQRCRTDYYANGISQGTPTLTRYYDGDYEEETNAAGETRKIHYLSDAVYVVTVSASGTVSATKLYYTYSDYQGSLIALADENGNAIERYAYNPWGVRRNPTDWTQTDSRTTWILYRGYTGHEHLDAFGIINMNGRVYDPYTGQFFSPDPYVQSPDNWLNYNRYTYCMGNPMKYTDPSGNLNFGIFYFSISLGWSPHGGFSFGLNAGLGIEKLASVGISLGYNSKSGSFSASINGGLAGFYAYAGYDTKGGFIAGAGFAVPLPSLGIVSFNSSLLSLGVNYSSSGGASIGIGGYTISSQGIYFDPSIGVAATAKWGSEVYFDDNNSNDVTEISNSKYKSRSEFIKALSAEGQGVGINNVEGISYGKEIDNDQMHVGKDGIIHMKKDGSIASAATIRKFNGFKVTGSIVMSPHVSQLGYFVSYNHELIHLYHFNKMMSSNRQITSRDVQYSENVAHNYDRLFFLQEQNNYSFDYYANPSYSPTDIPNYLIRLTPAKIPTPYWGMGF